MTATARIPIAVQTAIAFRVSPSALSGAWVFGLVEGVASEW
jgi:hypothetical protein